MSNSIFIPSSPTSSVASITWTSSPSRNARLENAQLKRELIIPNTPFRYSSRASASVSVLNQSTQSDPVLKRLENLRIKDFFCEEVRSTRMSPSLSTRTVGSPLSVTESSPSLPPALESIRISPSLEKITLYLTFKTNLFQEEFLKTAKEMEAESKWICRPSSNRLAELEILVPNLNSTLAELLTLMPELGPFLINSMQSS